MSAPSADDLPALPHVSITSSERAERQRQLVQEASRSLAVVVGWFGVAGALGALVWVQITSLPQFTVVSGGGGTMDEEQLAKQFAINGWFLVIAVTAGLVSGFVLLLLRRRLPTVMVGLVAIGGGVATVVMAQLGYLWGPGDTQAALAAAAVGSQVPVALKPDVDAVYYAWSVAALVGAALALWWLDSRDQARRVAAQAPEHAGASTGAAPEL